MTNATQAQIEIGSIGLFTRTARHRPRERNDYRTALLSIFRTGSTLQYACLGLTIVGAVTTLSASSALQCRSFGADNVGSTCPSLMPSFPLLVRRWARCHHCELQFIFCRSGRVTVFERGLAWTVFTDVHVWCVCLNKVHNDICTHTQRHVDLQWPHLIFATKHNVLHSGGLVFQSTTPLPDHRLHQIIRVSGAHCAPASASTVQNGHQSLGSVA